MVNMLIMMIIERSFVIDHSEFTRIDRRLDRDGFNIVFVFFI